MSKNKNTMKALRHLEWKSSPVWQDVAIPEPKRGEILIKMAGAGICHSDLHITEQWSANTFPQMQLPFTRGHENAGYVEKIECQCDLT
ncbi:MAG: alcohol dehydrogenase catalytic domain-containing protein [Desulfobulbales bacterium]